MNEKKFCEIWENIARKEIDVMIAFSKHKVKIRESDKNFRDNTFSRYEAERINFRGKNKIEDNDKIDRHKVAALFYVAFVDKINGYSFITFDSENKRLLDADSGITHETAFNISVGILESFISTDKEMDESYRNYVDNNGIIEPQLICFREKKTGYKRETIKQLIYAQKENKLSIPLVANMFFSLENNTLLCHKIEKK